ncbi:Putative Thioesterase domain, HotDog domain superfamily, acyl-coenzyme A thioesterase 13 [Septoria linicola]|uniref:Thioesterase domain, HotDog domain superfamily, acyl-coenzyme A thioesterase 13 n=1 Tax=Septoria linicola TaxID=215465 RepID=A0A9Q9EI73_9PEZI|nr:Putative Thioesterase domain, HotDog domain superfamily, acyl-coenzyme A thioesterase 13 [Septoria linicola]
MASNDDLKIRMTKALLQGEAREKYDKMEGQNFLLPWLDIVEITEAEKISDKMCRATFRFTVQPEFLNPMGTLHAGATSAMFECATTWALWPVAKPGFWQNLGLCRTINFVYLRPAVQGEVLLMECETVHVGKRIALLRAVMRREKDGVALVTCEHNKYNVDADVKI